MLPIAPTRSLTLDHRASYLCGAAARPLLAAASDDGDISIVKLDSGHSVRLRTGRRKINALSLHPSDPVLAIASGVLGTLGILSLDGSVLAELTPPSVDEAERNWVKSGFDGCLFTDDGDFLWCSAPISGGEIEIQLRETKEWSVVAKTAIDDPFEQSSTSFHRANGDVAALWVAAGQDGQQIFWMAGGVGSCRDTVEPHLRDTAPPAFSPSGREFLVEDGGGALRRYDYPPRGLVGTCETAEAESDPFADWVRYLDDRQALAKTFNSRIFLIDVPNMRILDEIALAGHEPRPIEHYYPTLRGDMQLCTDISYFDLFGDTLVFVSRADRGSGLEGWKDTLMFVPVKSLS